MRRVRPKLLIVPFAVAVATGAIASAAQLQLDSGSLTTLDTPVAGATTTTTTPAAPTVVLGYPGDVVRGSVTLNATATPGAWPIASVAIQRSPDGTTWTTICTDTSSPYSCAWNTTGSSDGDYSLRAVVTDTSNGTGTSPVVDVVVDNTPPVVTMDNPASPLRGTVLLSASATDTTSGIASVAIQSAPAGTSVWTTACTTSLSPPATYSCYFNTTNLAYGQYDFRAVATDLAGNTATSTSVRRLVDNTQSSVTMIDPGDYLRGTAVPLTATVGLPAGVTATSVSIQVAPNGTSTWTTVCIDTSSPYTCLFDSTRVPDGLYDFRAILLDSLGNTRTSTVVSARRVDNTLLRGFDVQAANGGANIAKLESGDTITLTYTEVVNLASLFTGWTGATQSIAVRVRDGGLLTPKGGATDDTLDVFTTTSLGTPVQLGSVNLRGDYVKGGRVVVFNATISAAAVTVSGRSATAVTLRLGTLFSGSGIRTAGGTPTMIWTPSASATDVAGNPCSTAPVSESGTADKDF